MLSSGAVPRWVKAIEAIFSENMAHNFVRSTKLLLRATNKPQEFQFLQHVTVLQQDSPTIPYKPYLVFFLSSISFFVESLLF